MKLLLPNRGFFPEVGNHQWVFGEETYYLLTQYFYRCSAFFSLHLVRLQCSASWVLGAGSLNCSPTSSSTQKIQAIVELTSFVSWLCATLPIFQYFRHFDQFFLLFTTQKSDLVPNPCRRAWQPTPVFLPGESHGQSSLEGYSPQVHKELDMTDHA